MLLKCQLEPFLQQLTSTVVSCNEVKKGKKKRFEVVLEDTVLFAEGGGQPCDHGVLRILAKDTQDISLQSKVAVSEVERRDGRAVHTTTTRLEVGSEVKVEVEWARRYDHMQQHTGQHLLSAVAEQEPYNYRTLSWNLGAAVCHVELSTPSITDEVKKELETKINRLIQQGLPVITKLYASKEDPGLSSAHTRGLPSHHQGPVRVVEIQGVDENMCCGTHLTSLSQLQAVKLLRTESKHGNTLLYFICGDRVLAHLQDALEVQQKLNLLLSSPPPLFPTMVEKLSKDSRLLRKQSERLSEELAQFHAERLLETPEDCRVLALHRPAADPHFSLALQRELAEELEQGVRVLLLTMGSEGDLQFVLRGSEELVERVGRDMVKVLGGKGGGRGGQFQGKFSDSEKVGPAVSFLRDNVCPGRYHGPRRPKWGRPN